MASGRLASGSLAAGTATQLYRNTTGNAQVITLLASSQVSGSTPKLNVKITNENFTSSTSVTTTVSGTNHTIATAYPSLTAQIAGASSYTSSVDNSGSRLMLNVGTKKTGKSMGQAWSKGYGDAVSNTRDHPWGKVAFDGQPVGIGGSAGGNYNYNDAGQSFGRSHMPCYDPYYFENPNAFNQNKARGMVPGSDSNTMYHIEDISKMDPDLLMSYYNWDTGASGSLYTQSAPSSDSSTYGTVTTRTPGGSYQNRGWIYDLYTGLSWGWQNSGYNSYNWYDEANPGTTNNSRGDSTSNGGLWRWSHGSWTGSDPQSYDTDGHGTPYGCYADCANGLVITTSGTYSNKMGFKYYEKYFTAGTMMNKDTRAASQDLETFSRSSYYHTIQYQGTARYLRLQWVAYHPGNAKWYCCVWDPSGDYTATGGADIGGSYTGEAGIFEVDPTKIYGKDQAVGNTQDQSWANAVTAGVLTKVGSVPDTASGLMSKPMRLKDSLWTAHCQNGKQYFSTDMYTWAEKSTTHMPDAYQMVNASKLGAAGTAETNYFVATDSSSIVYSSTSTVTQDVYDQAAVAGIIAKGAVTPYEQKSIILSDGDAIYVENEDATNAISITAMGVDV